MHADTSRVASLASISLISTRDIVHGIYDTIVGRDSKAATRGYDIGNYPPAEIPRNAIDNDVTTKYLSFGPCNKGQSMDVCGICTGLYLTLQRGPATVIGFQISTADDKDARDPIIVTLEGSNQSGLNLTLGTSWNLLYSGFSGLSDNPGRNQWGVRRYFANSIRYASYRFLVSSKRSPESSVQYAEIQLFGG